MTAERGIVASNSTLASEAGVEILRRGGNAVDAAVAVGFALAVTHPEAGNIGGGGFMLIRMVTGRGMQPSRGPVTVALDFREAAPLAATRDMYLGRGSDAVRWYRASGVPGSVAGLLEAHRRFGVLPRSAVLAPAVRLAAGGFVVDSLLAGSIAAHTSLIAQFDGKSLLMPNGRPLRQGSQLLQPQLARTLRAIAAGGADGFYHGTVAASIVAGMRSGGGLITAEDLARYRPVWRSPVFSTYRGHLIIGMPPPASGSLTMGEALAIRESLGGAAPFGSAAALHALASSLQLAFVDRMRLGDPDFGPVPSSEMLSRTRAARLASTIRRSAATRTTDLIAHREGMETTHYSVVDPAGNVVATTTTINSLFGSGVYLQSVGFFLNNEMDDFVTAPDTPNQFGLVGSAANEVRPSKRPLSSMTPTIVLDPSRRPILVIGARGGPRIISSTAQVIVNLLDYRMTLEKAMSAPRIHHQAIPDRLEYEVGGFGESVLDSLRAMGYELRAMRADTLPYLGRVVAVMRGANGWTGVVDPRFGALAAGF